MLKKLLPFLIGAGILFASIAYATAFLPFQGGTGSNVTPSNGQIPIGNGTGTYTPANLLCSGGCTITNASGSVTINQGAGVASTTITASGTTLTGPDFTLGSTTIIQPFVSGTIFLFSFLNPGFLSHASITATSPITFSAANVIACATCISTNTGNWAGTWQGVNSTTFYLSTNPFGFITNASVTAQSPIVWSTTSTITCPTCITSLANISSTNETISGYLQVSGALTDSAGNKYSTSTGGTAAGTSTNVQFNTGGSFDATSSLTYTSSTKTLLVGAHVISGGTPTVGVSTGSATLSFTSVGNILSWVSSATSTIVLHAQGGAGGSFAAEAIQGGAGVATGTFSSTFGSAYYFCVGGIGSSNSGIDGNAHTGGFCGGGSALAATRSGGGGGGMTWFSATSTFSTSTVLFVAGGGGGQGADNGGAGGTGGSGGGLSGVSGGNGTQGGGGGGGTQSTGGASGGGTAQAGSAGQGGNSEIGAAQGGGGGGGGYFGGGGGQGGSTGGGGAGGGSSFLGTLTATSTATSTINASGTLSLVFTSAQSVFGTDTSGIIAIGASTNSVALTFSKTYAVVPICQAQTSNGVSTSFQVSATNSGAVFIASSTMTPGYEFSYICL